MRGLIVDGFAGVSGDMFVAALVDLGLPVDRVRSMVEALGLDAGVEIERVDRSGLECARVVFRAPEETRPRHLSDILELLTASGLDTPVRDRAAAVFRRLAEAEAAIHGESVEEVHFHEVGAVDSILDVVCVVAGIHELGYTHVFTRPVAVGSGTVSMAHGTFPLPAPATVRLLEALPVRETGYQEECTTPTGAALVAELTGGRRPPADVVYGRAGYGAGSRNPADRPNCLRLIECQVNVPGVTPGADGRAVYALQADIDDMSPEYVAAARESVMAAGALDATVLRVDMKKGRPGVRLEALADEASLQTVLDAFMVGTTTIGVRYWRVERAILAREETVIEWRGHAIRGKRVALPDGTTRWKPEYEDVVAAARSEGLSPYEVRGALNEEEGHDGSGS